MKRIVSQGLWTRRVVLQRAMQLSALGVATPLAINLAAVGEAAAFDASDYKALVCVFMYGGNDCANTLIPYDPANYALYHQARAGGGGEEQSGIALARADLAATTLTPLDAAVLTDNIQYSLAPQLTGLKSKFDAGRLAILLNVGPLIQPTTLAQYQSENRAANPLPPRLFSHSDQQSLWQTDGDEKSTHGWGGRLGDLALSSDPSDSQLTCISASGNAIFVSGQDALRYQVSPTGAIRIKALDGPLRGAVRAIITRSSSHALEEACAAVTRRSIELEGRVNTAIRGVTLTTPFPGSNLLAKQLRVVARMIGANARLGLKRQVFFVSFGDFDHHKSLMGLHPFLMKQFNDAMGAFYSATVELGVANKVTAFTASDFGRSLASNADGSDHGWGSHHFVLGAAVNGGKFYGTAPHVSTQTDDQVGQGRLLPTTSLDQLGATLARWFGCSASEVPGILPNVGNFSNPDLGFMKAG